MKQTKNDKRVQVLRDNLQNAKDELQAIGEFKEYDEFTDYAKEVGVLVLMLDEIVKS